MMRSSSYLLASLLAACAPARLEVKVESYQGELLLSQSGRIGRVLSMAKIAESSLVAAYLEVTRFVSDIETIQQPDDAQLSDRLAAMKLDPETLHRLGLQGWHVRALVLHPLLWVISEARQVIDRERASRQAEIAESTAASGPRQDVETRVARLNDFDAQLDRIEKLLSSSFDHDVRQWIVDKSTRLEPAEYVRQCSHAFSLVSIASPTVLDVSRIGQEQRDRSVERGLLKRVALFAEKLYAVTVGLESFDRVVRTRLLRHHAEQVQELAEVIRDEHYLADRIVYPIWDTLRIQYPRIRSLTSFLLKMPERMRIPGGDMEEQPGDPGEPEPRETPLHEQTEQPSDITSADAMERARRTQMAEILAAEASLTKSLSKPEVRESQQRIRDLQHLLQTLRELEAPYHPIQPATAYLALEEDRDKVRAQGLSDSSAPRDWREITTVRVRAAGDSNHVVFRDAIGNWQVKRVTNDATELVRLQHNVLLAAIDLAVAQGSPSDYLRQAYRDFLERSRSGGPVAEALERLVENLASGRERELKRIEEGEGNADEKRAAKREVLLRHREILRSLREVVLDPESAGA